jgi:hypothetical protein
MGLSVGLFFTLMLSAESLWLFALSAHVARFMETVAPVFWVGSLVALWMTYLRVRPSSRRTAAFRMLLVGLVLVVAGAVLGLAAVASV